MRLRTLSVLLLPVLIAIVAIVVQQPSLDQYPELHKNIHELIEYRGFKSEAHFIQTPEGYILQVVRIVNAHIKDRSKLKPVLLHHGFQCSGTAWLIAANGTLRGDGTYFEPDVMTEQNQVGNSLAFVLATRGFDVWLANYRGNVYSINHTTLSSDDSKFWEFSIDELIRHDLPAVIDYMREKTDRQSIGYIGHSQGNIMMFGLLASQPHYSEKIKPFIALSPVFYTHKFYGPATVLSKIRQWILKHRPKNILTQAYRRIYFPTLCTNPILQRTICYWMYFSKIGATKEQLDFKRLPIYLDNLGMGSSTRNFVHILQRVDYVNMTYYDFEDEAENIRQYKQPNPPEYNVSNINSSDIALIYTQNDWINHLDNIHMLKDNLKVKLIEDYAVPDPTWSHNELLWAKQVGKYVNSKVLQILDKY